MPPEEGTITKILAEINDIKVMFATFAGKQELKDENCKDHRDATKGLDIRVRALELVAGSAKASSDTSHTWRDTLINAFTMAATVAATVAAILVTMRS